MLYIGCHLSSSKGFAAMGRQALELGANTFQFFTRNPRGSRAKDLDPADAAALRDLLARHGFGPIVAHAPYTLNLCGAEEKNRIFARETMADDLARLEHVPGQYYNFHPGSHVGQGSETGIALIADGLNAILRPNQATTVLLETMAGKGSEVGGRFEELRAILDRVELSGKVGVCLDTCHVSDGGYDIVHDLDGVPRIFNHNYFRRDCMPGLTKEIAQGSIYRYLEQEVHMSIVTSKRTITVEMADELDRTWLTLDGFNCLAVVSSQTYNSDGIMFEYTQSRHHPSIFRFQDNAVRTAARPPAEPGPAGEMF